jgi:signal transduction histidine kinase
MTMKRANLMRSMPFRLALALVTLFSIVSLASLAASYAATQRSLELALREGLRQDMAGFSAAPSAAALGALVDAEGSATNTDRLVLSYIAPNGRQYGNAALARSEDGYEMVSIAQGNSPITGNYLALSDTLFGGRLTIARSRGELDALKLIFLNILGLSLLPTILIALGGGLYMARRSARQVDVIGSRLDRLTMGQLDARVGDTSGWSLDLAQIGRKVDQMARAQETATSALRQVSTDIAHDLKTPIQRVAVHLDDLLTRNRLDPEARELLDQARNEIAGIAEAFHSLLQIANIEAGTPKSRFKPVDLSVLCQTFYEIYEPSATETGHILTLSLPDPSPHEVLGDRQLLGQMLANLIENALRHTSKGCTIDIELRQTDGATVLAVSDNGPGIPADARDLVLTRMYRLDRSRTTPGSGLGLSLVRVVAELHGATLTLDDTAPGLRVQVGFSRINDTNHSTDPETGA